MVQPKGLSADQDRSAIQLTVTTKPSVNYNDIPAGWVGVSAEHAVAANIAGLYTPDSSQPKLKGKITPNVLGCIGYLYAGGESEVYQKFIRFIKFGILVIPSNTIYDLYVLKTKQGHESMEFTATVHPAYMFDTVNTTTKFSWEITEGSDKVSIKKSGVRDNTCVVTAKGVDKLSTAVGDVKLKVTWDYNDTEKGEKEISLTVRSIWKLTVVNTNKQGDRTWIVSYNLKDQLNQSLPDSICKNLVANETLIAHLWTGFPYNGSATLTQNKLTDTFQCSSINLQQAHDGNGRQKISIDHMTRTHDISIPILGNSVIYSNIIYQRNQ